MKIAIIGTGNVGSVLARATKEAGHDVVVAARSAGKAEALAQELGVRSAASSKDAVEGSDAVVLAVPFSALEEVIADVGNDLSDKIVIDVTNPLKPDMSGLAIQGMSASEMIQGRVPGAKVVKALNTVFASNMGEPTHGGVPFDGLVAGDDAEAKKAVLELLGKIGYRPIDAGPLSAARYLEALGFLNISLNAANGWPWQSAWKLIGPTA